MTTLSCRECLTSSCAQRAAVRFVFAATFVFGLQMIALAQGVSRDITSGDFIKSRPTGKTPKAEGNAQDQRVSSSKQSTQKKSSGSRRYRLASHASPKTRRRSAATVIEQLGITLWRLRPARTRDIGQRLLVREKDKSSEWIPERIEADAPLRQGDRLRLSIESPRRGYLYIVDRDLHADGTMGEAMLIYPALDMRGGDNQVRAGKLIDIPAQEDDPNNFKASPNRPDQVGEVLSIIVTTSPLDLPIGVEPLPISASRIAQWEKNWAAATERFEMVGGAGQAWTKEEQAAAASRSTRQLTRSEPPPQTIYRVAATNKTAFIVEVLLKYGK